MTDQLSLTRYLFHWRDILIVVYLGSHRTGTTLFQRTLADNYQRLLDSGICFLGPDRLRDGSFRGLMMRQSILTSQKFSVARNSAKKLAATLEYEHLAGRRIILSEENLLGSIRRNVDTMSMYPNIQNSLEILKPAFEKFDVFYLSIKPLEACWNSCFPLAINVFERLPSDMQLAYISNSQAAQRISGFGYHLRL